MMEEHQKLIRKSMGRKAERVVFILLAVLLVTVSLFSTGKYVTLEEGEKEERYFTFSRTVDDFIDEVGIELNPQDRLLPAGETEIKDGQVVMLKRARNITLVVDGEEQEYWTHAKDAGAFLLEKGIILGEGDHISHGFTEELFCGDRIEVIRARVEYVREREIIPYDTLRLTNTTLDRGIVQEKQEGVAGELERIVAVLEQENGQTSRTVVSEYVIREPVTRILEYGENTLLARSGRTFEFSRILDVEVTAYCPGTPGSGCPLDEHGHSCCTGSYNDGYTYSGDRAVGGDGSLENPHIIAVDPTVIPFYSLVYLEDYGFARALDRGGAIKGMTVDLLFDRHVDALKFGRRHAKLYILND